MSVVFGLSYSPPPPSSLARRRGSSTGPAPIAPTPKRASFSSTSSLVTSSALASSSSSSASASVSNLLAAAAGSLTLTPSPTSLSCTPSPSQSPCPPPVGLLVPTKNRPIPNSYWATPLLVACEFPYCPLPADIASATSKPAGALSIFNRQLTLQKQCLTKRKAKYRQKLDALLQAGVRTFIDLTEPHELFPYSPHLAAQCIELGIDPFEVEYHNFPIHDRSLPSSVSYMREILAVLRDNEKRNRISAVHCRGGIGRTGMVVGCWLVESGVARDGQHALELIAKEWEHVEKCVKFPCSPETGPQVEFVKTFERAPSPLVL